MASWDMGYYSDHQYIFSYFHDMSPVHMQYMMYLKGYDFPEINEDFTYCELGVGQGITLNMFAATLQGQYYGTDFNASQINYARRLAKNGRIPSHFEDCAFHEYIEKDLPQFDVIALHGIFSWISHENQEIIIQFIKKKLKVGGVVYISYNTRPGFAIIEPVRHLMTCINKHLLGQKASLEERIQKNKEFLDRLLDTKPLTSEITPSIYDRYKAIFKQNHYYISGEYFNSSWDLFQFEEICERLSNIKLEFITTARTRDRVLSSILSPEQKEILNEHEDTLFYETLLDFMSLQTFRADLFALGPRRLGNELREKMDQVCFINMTNEADSKRPIHLYGSLLKYENDHYKAVLKLMSDNKIRSTKQIREALPEIENIDTILFHLYNARYISVCLPENQILPAACKRAAVLNSGIETELYQSCFYVSPTLGGAVSMPMLTSRLFTLFLRTNGKDEKERIKLCLQTCRNMMDENERFPYDCLSLAGRNVYCESEKDEEIICKLDSLKSKLDSTSSEEEKAKIQKEIDAIEEERKEHLKEISLNFYQVSEIFYRDYLPILKALKLY